MHVWLIVRKGQGLTGINDWIGLAYVTKEDYHFTKNIKHT